MRNSKAMTKRNANNNAGRILLGTSENVRFGRGLAEFRSGRPVRISGGGETLIALPVEGLDAARLDAFRMLAQPGMPRLVVTKPRARALGIASDRNLQRLQQRQEFRPELGRFAKQLE